MQMSGTLSVTVDIVDIEQTVIKMPAVAKGMNINLRAALAGRQHEDFIRIYRIITRHGQTLEYDFCEKVGKVWRVTYKIRNRTAEELAA